MKKIPVLFVWLFAAAVLRAAPFAQWFDFPGAGGKTFRIYGEGDDFSAWFEAEDGHAVDYNAAARAYEYLRRAADGSLAGTGILVGAEAGREAELAAIPLHLRDASESGARAVRARIEEFDRVNQVTERWEAMKAVTAARNAAAEAAAEGVFMAPPSWKTTGTLVGATILVDFPVSEGSSATLWQSQTPGITLEKIDRWLNGGPGVAEFGNYCSARQYYLDVSDGRFDYSNVIIGPYVMPHPRAYYDDSSKKETECAKLLFQDLQNAAFSSADRAKLSSASGRGVNIIFAGGEAARWSYGLWAHMSSGYTTFGGKKFDRYNISPLGSSPVLYAFCHENGHMMCDFPDLYSYQGQGHGMVGTACLMAARANDRSPSVVSAYLRMHAGWVEPKDLRGCNNSVVTVGRRVSDVYKYQNPNEPKEYYLIENRGGGHDGSMCGGGRGILIWHCNEDGDNTNIKGFNSVFAGETDNSRYRLGGAELTLEQADGLYQMERCQNSGDPNDLWHANNGEPAYTGEFSDVTCPTARWKNGDASALALSQFSAEGDGMTFVMGDPSQAGAPQGSFSAPMCGAGSAMLAVTLTDKGEGGTSVEIIAEFVSDGRGREITAAMPLGTVSSLSTSNYTLPLPSPAGDHYVRLRFRNNAGRVSVTPVQKLTPAETLDEALDAIGLGSCNDSESCLWEVSGTDSYYGGSCLRFTSTGYSAQARLMIPVSGQATVAFWAKVERPDSSRSCEFDASTKSGMMTTILKHIAGECAYDGQWHRISFTASGDVCIGFRCSSGSSGVTGFIDRMTVSNKSTTEPGGSFAASIDATALSQTAATLAVNVIDSAGEDRLSKTLVVSKKTDYSDPVYSGPAASAVNLTGLQPNTRYYAMATLSGAKTHCAIGSFKTPDWTPPSGAITVSDISFTGARVAASVTDPGSETGPVDVLVEVAGDRSFASDIYSGPSPASVGGLSGSTTYYVRATLTGELSPPVVIHDSFSTLEYTPPAATVAAGAVSACSAEVIVTVSDAGDGSTGCSVLVEAVDAAGRVAASAVGSASGVYTLAGLDRDAEYRIRVTVTGTNGLSASDGSLVVRTLGVPVILADPSAAVGDEGASATMSARVAFRDPTAADSDVRLYLAKAGSGESVVRTWNSYAQNDLLTFVAGTEPNVDYSYRFVATTAWNSNTWTSEVAGEFRTEYYVTNDWLTVDFEDYALNAPLPESDAGGAWTKAVGGDGSSEIADFASEFGKGVGLDQTGEGSFAKYTASAARPDGVRCLFDADMYFTGCRTPPESLTERVLATATTAIFLYGGGERNNFRIYTADGWTDVFAEGFVPAGKAFHHVTVDVDYDVSPARVRFTVDGRVLSDASGAKWFSRANPSNAGMLTAVSVHGSAKLDGFSAKMLEYGNSACRHARRAQTSEAKEATCTEDGCTAAYSCPDCGRVWTAAAISALGHAWNAGEVTKEPTYRETGVLTFTCTRAGCGATRTETIDRPVCPHAHTEVTGAKAATCTGTGSTGTETCGDCGAEIGAAAVIPALGHAWDAGSVTLEPTRTSEGVKTFTCTRAGCGAARTETIPMLPNIAAMRNIALVAAVGETLALPAKVRGLRPDAALADEYAVSWRSATVTPSAAGMTTVEGAVAVAPLEFRVTASIRAVNVPKPDQTPVNIAPSASCSPANGGVMFDGAIPTSGGKAATGSVAVSSGGVTLTWTDDKVVSRVVVYFYSNKNSSQPNYASVTFMNGSDAIECGSPATSRIYSKSNGSKDMCCKAVYEFTDAATLRSLTIAFPSCSIEELEVYGADVPSSAADPLATDTLSALEVDGEPVVGFAPATFAYTVTDGSAITSASATDGANMGITVLPKDNGAAYAVTLAENGSSKTYIVSMPPSVVCGHVHVSVTGAVVATCTTAGSTGAETCDDCGEVIRAATVVPALGHDWGEWRVVTEATETETGLMRRVCGRPGCGASEEKTVPAVVEIVALRNVAAVTAVGTAPELPARVAGLKSDGSVAGEYDVEWDPASAPASEGVSTVRGAATVDGRPMDVNASVRAVNAPAGGEPANIAQSAASMTMACSSGADPGDISALTNGWGAAMTIGGWNTPGNGWNTWPKDASAPLSLTVDFTWSGPKAVSRIFVASWDDNQHAEITLKNGSTGAELGGFAFTQDGNGYYKINQGDGNLYVFAEPVVLSRLRVESVKTPGGRYVGFYEIEVWGAEAGGGSAEPLSVDTLSALAVDGAAVAGFEPTTFAYTVENGSAITSATPADNMGVTILPKSGGAACVVTLAEDGVSTKTYTVAMPETPVNVDVVVTNPDGTVERRTVDRERLSELVADSDYGTGVALPKLDGRVELALAPGVHVKLADGQAADVVAFILPQDWYRLGEDGDGVFAELDVAKVEPAAAAIEFGDDGSVRITASNAKSGLIYGVRRASSLDGLVSNDADTEWLDRCETAGELRLSTENGVSGASGFFRIVVTDDPRSLDASR